MSEPKWVELAKKDLGVHEIRGPKHNDTIVQYFKDVGKKHIKNDETAWCAAFVGSCLERAGIASTKSLVAKSYLNWGIPTKSPKLGTVVVLHRGSPKDWRGHVGFYIRETDNYVYVLGGNQSNTVSIESYPKSRVAGYRDPIIPEDTPQVKVENVNGAPVKYDEDPAFTNALEAVLLVEGGFSDHPRDPGGATNRGVTIREFAHYKGERLTDENYSRILEQLKRITDEQIREIYWRGYWIPSSCNLLPDGVSLYVFDTSVMHGVGIGKKVLQQSLGVDDDGVIGPVTLKAVDEADVPTTIKRMRDIRIERLKKSKNWDVFGKGWTNRINAIYEDAIRAAGFVLSPPVKDEPMAVEDIEEPEIPEPPKEDTKHPVSSVTIWGATITFLTAVLPELGKWFGYDIQPGDVQVVSDNLLTVIQSVGGLVGTFLAVYGRIRATKKIGKKT